MRYLILFVLVISAFSTGCEIDRVIVRTHTYNPPPPPPIYCPPPVYVAPPVIVPHCPPPVYYPPVIVPHCPPPRYLPHHDYHPPHPQRRHYR